MDHNWEQVREFHERFGHPVAATPTRLSGERSAQRCAWMREEIQEFEAATDVAGQTDAMIDLIYFALGTLVEMGVRPERCFDIVHQANLRKLWPDGRPRHRDDAKTVKPPGWGDPGAALTAELARQQAEARTAPGA